jgi:hypothetical protein
MGQQEECAGAQAAGDKGPVELAARPSVQGIVILEALGVYSSVT